MDKILLSGEKIRLYLPLKDSLEELVLNFYNVFYLLTSPYNLVSLDLLNDSDIFYYNKNETLYQIRSKKTLALV